MSAAIPSLASRFDLTDRHVAVTGAASAPGPIRTNIGGSGPIPEDIERKWSSTVLLGRMGSPYEIQGLANLLASDASSFMTGAVIALDGGGTSGYFATQPRADR